MIERALLAALVALALIAGLSAIGGALKTMNQRIECGFAQSEQCITVGKTKGYEADGR